MNNNNQLKELNNGEELSPTKNHLEGDFLGLKEIFQINEIGIIRLSKLVPENTEVDEIITDNYKQKINFYRNFLGIDISINITKNEIFAGYKKVSIDIKGNYTKKILEYIFESILIDFKNEGFKENFIAFEILKDVSKKVLEGYKKNIGAESVINDTENTITNSILWLESVLLTREDGRKLLRENNIFEEKNGENDLEDYLIQISHNTKLDEEFKETLELVYRQLIRYRKPKSQGLIRLLGHNVEENIDSKKVIPRIRSRFSIRVSKLIGNGTKKSIEKEKQKSLVNPNNGLVVDRLLVWLEVIPLVNPNNGLVVDNNLNISEETNLGNRFLLKEIDSKEYKELLKGIKSIFSPFANTMSDIFNFNEYNGIKSLEKIFTNKEKIGIKSFFDERLYDFIDGEAFFDNNGIFIIEGNIDFDAIIKKTGFKLLIIGLLKGDFDYGKRDIYQEIKTYEDLKKYMNQLNNQLLFYIENDSSNGVKEMLFENIDIFKQDIRKRKFLLKILIEKGENKNKVFVDIFRELGKKDSEFRKLYVISNIGKIEKIQVLKELLKRNKIDLKDVWIELNEDLKNKFLYVYKELFDYNIQETRYKELLNGLEEEIKFLLRDESKILLEIFEGLYGNDNYLEIEEKLKLLSENDPILKDIKRLFLEFLENRKKQIQEIENRKQEIMQNKLKKAISIEDLLEIKYVFGEISKSAFISFTSENFKKDLEEQLEKIIKLQKFAEINLKLFEFDNILKEMIYELGENNFFILDYQFLRNIINKYKGKGILVDILCTILEKYIPKPIGTSKKNMTRIEAYEDSLIFKKEYLLRNIINNKNIIINKNIINNKNIIIYNK